MADIPVTVIFKESEVDHISEGFLYKQPLPEVDGVPTRGLKEHAAIFMAGCIRREANNGLLEKARLTSKLADDAITTE